MYTIWKSHCEEIWKSYLITSSHFLKTFTLKIPHSITINKDNLLSFRSLRVRVCMCQGALHKLTLRRIWSRLTDGYWGRDLWVTYFMFCIFVYSQNDRKLMFIGTYHFTVYVWYLVKCAKNSNNSSIVQLSFQGSSIMFPDFTVSS